MVCHSQRDFNLTSISFNNQALFNSPCAERKMDPGTYQICPQTWRLTSSTSPVIQKVHLHSYFRKCNPDISIQKRTPECVISTHGVRHCDFCVWHKFDFAFTGQIYIHNSVAIEANLQFLVCPQIIIFSIFICLTNNALKKLGSM